MPKRIYKAKLYICAVPQGISGFRQPSVPAIVTGLRLKRDSLLPWSGQRLGPLNAARFRLEDGRLPEFQTVVSDFAEVEAHLAKNPTAAAYYILT